MGLTLNQFSPIGGMLRQFGVFLLFVSVLTLNCKGEDWKNLVIKEINFRETPLEQAGEFISKEVNRAYPDVHLKFKYDFTPPELPDPRIHIETVSSARSITLSLRNVPVEDVLKYACSLAGGSHEIHEETITVTFNHPIGPGYLFVAALGGGIAVFGRFDCHICLDGQVHSLDEILKDISEETDTEIILDRDLALTAWATAVTIPKGRFPAFWLLKAIVEVLHRATHKDIVLYKPLSYRKGDSFEDTGGVLCVGIRPPRLGDVRASFPIFAPIKGSKKNEVESWNPRMKDDVFQKMLEDAKDGFGFELLSYEPKLNCFWEVGPEKWWETTDGLGFNFNSWPSWPVPSFTINFGTNAEVNVRQGPKRKIGPSDSSSQ